MSDMAIAIDLLRRKAKELRAAAASLNASAAVHEGNAAQERLSARLKTDVANDFELAADKLANYNAIDDAAREASDAAERDSGYFNDGGDAVREAEK